MSSPEIKSPMQIWDERAIGYHQHLEAGNDPFQDFINTTALLNLFPDAQDALWIMDAACGNGRFATVLTQNCPQWKIVAFDGSPTLVNFVQEKISEGSYHNMVTFVHDITQPNSNIGANAFNIVLMKMVFPSLPNIDSTIKEAHRILRSGGKLIISTLDEDYYETYLKHNYEDWYTFLYRNLLVTQRTWSDVTDQEIQAYMAMAKWDHDHYPNAVWVPVSRSNFWVPAYQHTVAEIEQSMKSAGFEFDVSHSVGISEEFAQKFPMYRDRKGKNITWNSRWIKYK
jgi:ubiquinone/menaquinone biosynthesis C-methylase UbiE